MSPAAMARTHPFLRPSRIPVVIVCGPPGSGKSTYVAQHAGADDLVIDLDLIKARLSGYPLYQAPTAWTAPALDERNRMLAALADNYRHPRAWFIVSAPERDERELWRQKLGAIDVVVMTTPLDECVRRIRADPRRTGYEAAMIEAAERWFERASL